MHKEVAEFASHENYIHAIEWNPYKEEVFASGCQGGQLSFWSMNHGNLHDIKNAHNKNILSKNPQIKTINSLDWHPNGQTLASAGVDSRVRVWTAKKPYPEKQS
mmetsp:Transcript_16541/g.28118  ORF Transcript_16541/g.28118 Transcript_16541/m.28118 type:complete len:104 (-) Transcript_16541:24-335(-)